MQFWGFGEHLKYLCADWRDRIARGTYFLVAVVMKRVRFVILGMSVAVDNDNDNDDDDDDVTSE